MTEKTETMTETMSGMPMMDMMDMMMSFHLTNFLTLLAAVAITFVVGGLWYGPLFGKAWWAEQPHRKSSKSKGATEYAALGMAVQVLHLIAVGFVVFALAHFTSAWCAFVMLGVMTSLGMISAGIWLGQSRKLVLLNIGQHLLTLAIFAVASTL